MSATTEKIVADRVIFLNGSIPPSVEIGFFKAASRSSTMLSAPPYQPLCRGYGTVRRSCVSVLAYPEVASSSGSKSLVILPH